MAAAQDSPDLDAQYGFARPEMFSEALAGTWKEKTDVFLFLIYGKAADWPEDIKDLPADTPFKTLQNALKEAKLKIKVKVALAEATHADKEGDVLVFPGAGRFNITGGTAALIDTLRQGRTAESSDVEDSHVFVCAHRARDGRCGHCGPRLAEAVAASGSGAAVRKCSHVGGHAYAGNVLVFSACEGGGQGCGDFYGYVTPGALQDVLSGRARRSRLWRGALGLSRDEVLRARKVQLALEWAPAALIAVAVAGGALAWWRRRGQR